MENNEIKIKHKKYMKESDIKPIPKYILKLIQKKDRHDIKIRNGKTRFYSYLSKCKTDLLQITVACKNRGKKWYCKQVAIHALHSKECFVKDIEYFFMGGYVVGWYEQGLTTYRKYYEKGYWEIAYDKYYNPFAPIVNLDYVFRFPQYKYCAINETNTYQVLKYLRLYEKYPQIEMLVKFGFYSYYDSKQILEKVAKDNKFKKWLIQNRYELNRNFYYIRTVFNAYKQNKPLQEVQKFEKMKQEFSINNTEIKEIIKKEEYEKFFKYIEKQETDFYNYRDYLIACQGLELDMNIERNRYPHNFKRWHDIRIDEYHSKQAEIDRKKKEQLNNQFAQVANKYITLQRNLKDKYITLIAKSPAELINEGEKLHHCVGRMGYDQKFAREETLIFFIRLKENQNTPLVTVEYSIKNHKVLQCYADHDSRPCDEIQNYVYKTWLPYANRKLRQIAI